MKTKRLTTLTQVEMGKTLDIILEARAWRLLGVNWKKWIEVSKDITNGDLVFKYE